jgi:hypothetical protein
MAYKSAHMWWINPNPHYFIAITKATACGWKEPLLPLPLHSPVRGRGKGVLNSSTALKICLIKTWVTLKLSQNIKMTFLMKTSETKKFFARHFWFKKNIWLQPSRTYFYFYKKGFLNSQAVRIRVKFKFIKYGFRQSRIHVWVSLSWEKHYT